MSKNEVKEEVLEAGAIKPGEEEVLEAGAIKPGEEEVLEAGAIKPGEETVRIKIHKDKNDKRENLFVSIGTRNFVIRLGEWVNVPVCVAKILEQREERMEESERFIRGNAK